MNGLIYDKFKQMEPIKLGPLFNLISAILNKYINIRLRINEIDLRSINC